MSHTETLSLAIDDPGLLYGATLFTTLRVYHQSLDNRLTNWQAHCDRLRASLQSFGWQQPDWQRVRHGAQALIGQFPILRVTIFSDGREWITGRFLPDELPQKQHCGVSAYLPPTPQFQRSLPAHKTGNYLSAWLAKATAQNMQAQEAIFRDASGNWLETSTGNLWGWRDGSWWTPPLTAGILPGVVRSQLVNWLLEHYQPAKEEPWLPETVAKFVAIAYTNSVVEVIPIHTVLTETSQLDYNPYHQALQQLRSLFLN